MGKYFDATGLSLVKTSDQLIENMHQFVHKMMSRRNYYVKHVENPHHSHLLFKAVQHLNCMNIYVRNKQYLNIYSFVFVNQYNTIMGDILGVLVMLLSNILGYK